MLSTTGTPFVPWRLRGRPAFRRTFMDFFAGPLERRWPRNLILFTSTDDILLR
jgi:hypothetical protein